MLEEASNRLTDLATAIADGRAVDWEAVESSSLDEEERVKVRRLRAIADIGRAHAAATLSDSFSLSTSLSAGIEPMESPAPGMTWGSLRIVERIGRGRFGDVYRAWDPSLDREVALKLLRHCDADPDTSAKDQEVVEEGRLMARVRHPNVVTIFGAQRLEGRTGLWMEYIPGRTLEAELKERGPFSAAEVAQVGIALCRALAAVHAAGLVHRDVKAQNVLRDPRGHVLLGDFGTGRELDDGDPTPGIAGTPAYLAPEVFRREPATPQSDLYSLGALLFHLATGSFPVSGRSLRELRDAHSEGRRTSIQTSRPNLLPSLAAVIETALNPDPACRFSNAAAMETALAAAIAPRSKPKWLIAAGTVALVGGVLAFAVSQDGQAPSGGGGVGIATSGADSRLIRSLGDRAIWTGRGVDMFGRVSPDGRLISYVDWFAYSDLAVHDIAANTNRLLTHKTSWPDMDNGWAGYSVFSPDSRQLAYGWADDHEIGVRILSPFSTAAATTPRQLIRFDRKDVRFAGPLDWSPDGRLIALGLARTDGSGQIIVASVSDGSFRPLKSIDWNGPVHIFFSRDSKYIAYDLSVSESNDQHDLYVLAIDGRQETVVAAHPANEWVIGWTPDGSHLLFSSDRTGSNGLWAVPMANGKPSGRAELLRPDIGHQAYSLGLTSSGAAVVLKAVTSRDLRVQGIDLSAGTLVGPPVAFTQGFVPGTQDPNWSADGKSVAYQACRGLSSCVVIRNVDTGEVRRFGNRVLNYGRDPRWSPDGSSLLVGSRDSKGRDGIFRYEIKTDVLTPLTYGPPTWSSPRWSADGSKIYFDRHFEQNPRIVERDLRSETERDVFVGEIRNFEVSPDGTQLAVKTPLDSATKTARLLLVPVNGGPPRELMRFNEQEYLTQTHTFAWSPDSRSVLTARRSGASVALWLVPTGDGHPRRLDIDVDEWALADLEGFPSDDSGFALSRDGARIAYLVGRSTVEVWALENIIPSTAGSAARPVGDRVVKAGELITWGDGRVSLDGRFISYTDWMFTGNLMLHDLAAGTDRALTDTKDWSVGNAYTSTFSRDGRLVAYGWRTYGQQAHVNELRIVSTEGTGIPQPRRVYGSEDIDVFYPSDWSPDGHSLAVRVVRKDRTAQIALIGVQDRSFRALKTVGWRGPNKIFFSPDGKHLAYDLPASDTEAQRDVFIIAVDGSHETPAVDHPADDVVMGWSRDGRRLLFASDRTGDVGLWTVPVAGGKPNGAPTLLKPDIGSVLSQGLTGTGALHIVKDASTLSLQVAPIDLDAGKLSGPPVLENFRSGRPAWSGDGRLLAYRVRRTNGRPVVSVRSVDSGEVRELRPALAYFNEPYWLPDARSLVVFGRNFKGRGGIYRIDAQTGRETLIAEPADINPVQVSPDGRKIYYKIGYDNPEHRPARIVERDLISGETRDVHRKGSSSEGSVELSPDGRSLATIVTDEAAKTSTIMLIPIDGGEPRELLRVSLPDRLAPYGNMSWTPDSRAVIVVKTSRDRKELWRVPTTGGGAQKLDIDMAGWVIADIAGIRLHPSGRQIAFFVGQDSREVWALENVLPQSPTQ